MADMKVTHIVVAGGSGSRFGSQLPKQYCELEGVPVVMRAIDSLRRATPGAEIVLVISVDMEPLWRRLCERHGFVSPLIAYGGTTRWESVRNGLAAVSPDTTVVSVHDGARPLVSGAIVHEALETVRQGAHGAVPAVPVTDSLRHLCAGDTSHGKAVARSEYVAVQTPQVFDRALLDRAYAMPWREEFTDDASVMEAAGYSDLRLTAGSPYNIKITNPLDLAIAGMLLRNE